MTRKEILEAAEKCICGDREQDYGSPERSFGVIGQFWETYLQEKCLDPMCSGPLEVRILPEDVAAMMCLFKIARIEERVEAARQRRLANPGLAAADNAFYRRKRKLTAEGVQA